MFTWMDGGWGGSIGVKYWRGSSLSIGWFWVGIAAIPWIMTSKSLGVGEGCAV